MDWLTIFLGLLVLIVIWNWLPKKEKDLNGKTVLITGAGSGLGRLMAIQFAKLGCKLVLLDINQQGLEEVAKEVVKQKGLKPFTASCDVSDKDSVKAMAKKVKTEVGVVDILVNNAGIVAGGYALDLRDDQVERVMRVNTLAVIWMIRAFLPDMMEQNSGHLVTIASAAATSGVAKLADYCASKWATFGYHESIRMELKKLGKTGVKTTVVCPYYINTGMFDGVKSKFPLLPIMEPDYVVSNIMRAVKTNQEELMLPSLIGYSALVRTLLSPSIRDIVADWIGISTSMDEFAGKRRV